MSITFEAKTFPVGSVAENLIQASVKLVFGKKVGETKVMSTNGVATTQPLIWNKDANLLFLTQPSDTAFAAGDITDFKGQVAAEGFPVAYQDSSATKFNAFRPLYLSPSFCTLETGADLLYHRGVYSTKTITGGRPLGFNGLIEELAARANSLEGTYDAHFPTTAEGITYQEGLYQNWSDMFSLSEVTAILDKLGYDLINLPTLAEDGIAWPGCFYLSFTHTSWGANDPTATFTSQLVARPRFAERWTLTDQEIDITVQMANGSFLLQVEVTGTSTDPVGINIAFSKTNWNDRKDTTWHLVTNTDAVTNVDNLTLTRYVYSTDAGNTSEADITPLIEAVGLPRSLLVQMSSYLMDLDGVANNGTSLIADIGYWVECITRTSVTGVLPGRLDPDPVDDWTAYAYECHMTERDLIFLGYIPSFSGGGNSPEPIAEILLDGLKQAAEAAVPMITISRKAKRVHPTAIPQFDAWFYRTGDDMEQAFRDLKVAQGVDFPADVTEQDFVDVGDHDYLFAVSDDFVLSDADWVNSSFVGAIVDGQTLTEGNTYVGEDDLGELVDWGTAQALLTTNRSVGTGLGGMFVTPFDPAPTAVIDYTMEVDSDGSISLQTPADNVPLVDIKALVAMNHSSITLIPSAELSAHYANPSNALSYSEYEAQDRKGNDAMLAEWVFRYYNDLSWGVQLTNSLVFKGLQATSYISYCGPYDKIGGTRNEVVRLKLAQYGSMAEYAIIQAQVDEAARVMLGSIASAGISYVHGL